MAMVRDVPIHIHNKLHNQVLHDVPKPDEKTLRIAYNAYLDQKTIVDSLGICQLILWLCDEIPDEAFQACMMRQYEFFRSELSGGLNCPHFSWLIKKDCLLYYNRKKKEAHVRRRYYEVE